MEADMRLRSTMLMLALAAASAPAGTATGAELAQIAPNGACPVVSGQSEVPVACEAPAGKKLRSTMLTAVPGKITFELPDGVGFPGASPTVRSGDAKPTITVEDLMIYNGRLAPDVWRLNAGDVVNIKL